MSLYFQIRAFNSAGTAREVARVNGDTKEPAVRTIAQKIADQLGERVEVRRVNDAVPWKRVPERAASRLRRNPKRGARKRATKATPRRRNPATGSQAERAAKTFRKWHGFNSKGVIAVKGTRSVPARLVKLGEMPEIVYRSDKWTGKSQTYLHKFGRPRPLLATDPDGKRLFIIGGGYRVTARGLVD